MDDSKTFRKLARREEFILFVEKWIEQDGGWSDEAIEQAERWVSQFHIAPKNERPISFAPESSS